MDAKIHLEVWAGALGVPIIRKDLDAAELDSSKRAELERLILTSHVLELPENPPPPPKTRDANQTKLVVSMGGKTKTIRVSDDSIAPAVREVIDFVKAHGD